MDLNQAKAIVSGFTNLARSRAGIGDKDIEELAAARMEICQACKLFRKGKCNPNKRVKHSHSGEDWVKEDLRAKGLRFVEIGGEVYVNGCGCNLSAKVRQQYEGCPAAKW